MTGYKPIIRKFNSEIVLLLALMGLVFLASNEKLTFIYGITFTFSSVFMFLILRIYGLTATIVTGVIAILFVPEDFSSVHYSIVVLIESVFVGLFFVGKRKSKMFFVDALFWLLGGALLLFFIYRPAIAGNALYFQISKDILNGLTNVLIADMLLAYFPFYKLVKSKRISKNNVSIHQFISHITIFSILVPFFISLVANTLYTYETISEDLVTKADARATRIEKEVRGRIGEELETSSNEVIRQLEDIIAYNKSIENDIIIVNDKNHIIASSLSMAEATMGYNLQEDYRLKEVSSNLYEGFPIINETIHPIVQWAEGSYFYVKQVGSYQVVLKFPIAQYQEEIFIVALDQLKYLFLFAIGIIILVAAVSRMLTNNIKQLTTITTGLPQKLRNLEIIDWPQSTIAELRVLSKNLRKMADKLKEQFQESIEMNAVLSEQTAQLRESEEKLHRLAFYDGLTSLPNRYYFQKYVRELIRSTNNKHIAIIFIDLNQFKQINDTLGHDEGDRLLKITANKLKKLQQDNREVFRLGGDEFVIVHYMDYKEEVKNTLELVLKEFSTYFEIGGLAHYITASVGVSMYPDDGDDLDTLVKYADIAMYMSKEQGGNIVQFFDQSMKDKFQSRLIIENALRAVVEKGNFEQFYQPKTLAGKVTSIEALLRWNDPKLGPVSPGLFIPIAEEIGLISQIDDWSLVRACVQNKLWQDEGILSVPISVNISATHFQQDYLVSMVKKALDISGLEPQFLKLEITESVFIKDPQHVAIVITDLKKLGVQISIDDFGKGYSSLYQLLKLPIDEIKIDRQFIQNIDQNEKQELLVKSIFDIAHGLRLNVVAEGVETEKESRLLVRMGCDEIQGYLYSPPLGKDEFVAFLLKESRGIELR